MSVFLAVLTYFAYVFIVVMYAVKALKIARAPVHLRWELYPVIHEPKSNYGSAYYEDVEQWRKNRHKTVRKGILFLLKENFCFSEYFKRNRGYWLVLLPWHIGFILIVAFHIMCFFGALVMIADIPVSAESTFILGRIFYFLILLTGVISFVAGSFGSIGLVIKRLSDKDLKAFTTPQNYFNYLFTLVIFLSGLYAWYFVDPAFSEYREFWKGLVTMSPVSVEPPAAAHIILFALFLIYLPFTRSLHYITKFFAYLWVRWDDQPNARGSKLERDIKKWLKKPVSWQAPHIPSGRTWAEIVSEETSGEEKP
ncbi:MAG TPA: respiratory nitrate reductase subunit gamma [Dehalococcoidales bacterium]|nr:respiratory nitrate reductase subunit gamma [Dehalococcoidales bacterium]